MIPRLMHSRISPLPSEVTVCSSVKVNGLGFDGIVGVSKVKARYHALLPYVKILLECAPQSQKPTNRLRCWALSRGAPASRPFWALKHELKVPFPDPAGNFVISLIRRFNSLISLEKFPVRLHR